MNHRIFIAINFPEDIKKKLSEYENKWLELPCRWVKKENLHITLAFLGYISDEELVEILKITQEVASRHEPFFITLNKILYGPPKKMPPRMVWVEGEKSEDLGKLQKDLENALASSDLSAGARRAEAEAASFAEVATEAESAKAGAKEDSKARPYAPHITLGRLKEWEFRRIEPEERPEVNEEISLSFEVNSIEVMESELKRGGPEYSILESCPLKS